MQAQPRLLCLWEPGGNPPGFPWSRLSYAGRFALAAGWRGSSPAPRPHAASVLPVPAAFRLCELFVSCVKAERLSKESFKQFKCILIRSGQMAQEAIRGATPFAWKHTFAHALLSHLQTPLPSITGPWEAQLAKYLDPSWQPAVSPQLHAAPSPAARYARLGQCPLHPLSQPPTALPAPGPCPFPAPSLPPLVPDPGVTYSCNSHSAYIHY